MTECERLLMEGKLPKEFLQPEMRECEVPVEMKKLWALQIDLIQQVKKIASKHNLTFFALGGTAIGAVRHKGFIPWDDDIDIAFKRNEYNEFLKYAQEELSAPYFVQIPTTDKAYFRPFISLRNSNATCIASGDSALKCNNGAIIHIFPLDGYTDNKRINNFIRWEKLKNNAAINRTHKKAHKKGIAQWVYTLAAPFLLRGSNMKHYINHEQTCTAISQEDHEFLGIQFAHFGKKISNFVWNKHVFDSAIMMPFEYSEIPVPVGYDEMLRGSFGDYMKLPDEKDRINKHTWEMDLDTPYKEYCSRKYGVVYDE